jgi:F-type H+-transporting ATPase subunit a
MTEARPVLARLAGLTGLALTFLLMLPATALGSTAEGEEEEFNPEHDFEIGEWIPIHIGPLDLSINKAVAYLLLATVCTIGLGLFLMRAKIVPDKADPGRRQALGEIVYEVAQTQVAEQGLPHKAIRLWFPYVASLMLFIWVINMLGFIPLPLSNEKFTVPGTEIELPTLAVYAATSSISVTVALAFMTFVFTHVEGIRHNGPVKYFKSWIPDVPKAMYPLIVPLEILGQFMRLISLSVRLYANMLAGHMLILTFIGLIFVLENIALAVFSIPLATLFYLFEVIIVVSIQAFIFAALSAIYIGSAIEPEH